MLLGGDGSWADELSRGKKSKKKKRFFLIRLFLFSVTNAGFGAVLSAPWYLNYVGNPYDNDGDWVQYYVVEPLSFNGTEAQKKLVLGGEGTMWGEFTGNSNVVSRTWPRAAAVGERLWSSKDVTDTNDARNRLSAFTCELIRRGINAEPVNGPDFCKYELD